MLCDPFHASHSEDRKSGGELARSHIGLPCQTWHIVTCEYPPQIGGVSDYTLAVANGLAAHGQAVHIWCPAVDGQRPRMPGVTLHPELGGATPDDLRRIGRLLDRFTSPRRILVQWVPHGYGYRSMNLWFCLWLWGRARKHDDVDVMVHEAFLAFGEGSWKQPAAAAVHRLMTAILLRAARRVWVSTPAWSQALRPYAMNRPIRFSWLPVPSNVPIVCDGAGIQAVRNQRLGTGNTLIGHFGTYGKPVSSLLAPIVARLIEAIPDCRVLLFGNKSDVFCEELLSTHRGLAGRVQATGLLSARDLSMHLQACDLLVQPYPDGVSTRRGSVMAALSHAVPVVTTSGRFTERVWQESRAVRLIPINHVDAMLQQVQRLLADPAERMRMSELARTLYSELFDIRHTIDALLEN